MANANQMFTEIRRQARGVPNPTKTEAIIRAARIFCQQTQIIRRDVQFNTQANVHQYPLTFANVISGLNPSEEVIGFRHWQITQPGPNNTSSIVPGYVPYGTTINPNWAPNQPWSLSYIFDGIAQLDPIPNQAYLVQIECITQPAKGSVWIPDELLRKFDQAIGYGALEWLHGMDGNPWYSEQKAAKNRILFNDEIARGRRLAMYDNTPGPRAWVRRPFAQKTRWRY